jgi:hypothetical protein
MSETPFHTTRMGATFYETTMPDLVRQVARMNELLARIATALETRTTKEKNA